MSHVDRLVFVSKLLYEPRVAELLHENEELRLQLFWKDHNVQKLKKKIRKVRDHDNSPMCYCNDCMLSGREAGYLDVDGPKECLFIAWLDAQVASCGLIKKNKHELSSDDLSGISHVSDTSLNIVRNADCHIVNASVFGYEWTGFTYGRKLWAAKSVNDVELQKLKRLFELLDTE